VLGNEAPDPNCLLERRGLNPRLSTTQSDPAGTPEHQAPQFAGLDEQAIGYTPGDTWNLYLGRDDRIEEMVYHRRDPKSPVARFHQSNLGGLQES
jgi:hypothetical protein